MRSAPATLSEAIFVKLRTGILAGRPAPGEPLASERALAGELGCNRHAIREAVKRLQQAGLVEVSHGGATRVLDWRASGSLDLLAELPLGAKPDPVMLRSILELRRAIGVDAARLCAQRAPGALVEALRAQLAAEPAADPAAAPLRYARLWEHIIDGADNLAYRLAYNSLIAGLDPAESPSQWLFGREACDLATQRALVAAIAARDAEAAAGVAVELLSRALAIVLAAAVDGPELAGG